MKLSILFPPCLCRVLGGAFIVSFFGLYSCKKSDDFYDKLEAMPQIDQSVQYAYQSSYVAGDIMKITGFLQPDNQLKIFIGGIEADIVKKDTIVSPYKGGSRSYMDLVSIQLTPAMAGVSKTVKITSGGYSVDGPPIDIYLTSGTGSFNSALSTVQVSELSPGIQFLHCMNGKGDVYYFDASTKIITRINKNGLQTTIANLSANNITAFLAGAVDPTASYLYYSIRSANTYELNQLDLHTGKTLLLNRSNGLAIPYDGPVATAQLIVSGIFPDSKGNLFLSIGMGNQQSLTAFIPDAIAVCNLAEAKIIYLFKGLANSNSFRDMPGSELNLGNVLTGLRFSPDEGLLYALQSSFIDFSGVFSVFDLIAKLKIAEFATNNADGGPSLYRAVGAFNNVHINIREGSDPNAGFGFMPMPGKRLQTLVYQQYQQAANYGFPKWIVMDFSEQRTYAYAQDQFLRNGYNFLNGDMMLNYDEDGNLYSTALNRSYLIKTKAL